MHSSTVLIGYYALAAIFYLFVRVRGGGLHAALVGILVCIPIAGLPMAAAAYLSSRRPIVLEGNRFEEILEMQSGGSELLNPVDVVKEANTIPIEDALEVNDHRIRRRVVLDALKLNSLEIAPLLAKAAQNDDTETSHYAVAAVMEMKRKMLAELQKLTVAYEKNPGDRATAVAAVAALRHYLDAGLMDERMERTYRNLQVDMLDRLIVAELAEEEHYAAKIDSEMRLSRYDRARDACERFLKHYPHSEEAYYFQLKLWYSRRSSAHFAATMEALKQSKIKVSHQTLSLIRYWNAGV